MALKRQIPKYKKYKFYSANVWGRIFLKKAFREKDILFARFNRKMTLKTMDVNPVKLRHKRLSMEGRGMRIKYLLKQFYFNYKEHQFRKVYSAQFAKRRKLVHEKVPVGFSNDLLLGALESTLSNVLFRSGLFKSPHAVRFLIAHKEVLLNGRIATYTLEKLEDGDLITFKNTKVRTRLMLGFTRLLVRNAALRRRVFRLKSKEQASSSSKAIPYYKKNRFDKNRGVSKKPFVQRKGKPNYFDRKLKYGNKKTPVKVRYKLVSSPKCRLITPVGHSRYLLFLPKLAAIKFIHRPLARDVYYPFALNLLELNAHYKGLS